MLYYDVDLNSWVRQPGSSEPSWITPVLTVGSTHAIQITFVKGFDIQDVSGATWFLGIKSALNFAGDYIGSNSTPTEDGENVITFILDLDTVAAKAYFVTNPTTDTLACNLQVVWTIDDKISTNPLGILLQNTYLQDQ
jgi:hypothetical protein